MRANEKYEEEIWLVLEEITKLKRNLLDHQLQQSRDAENWCYVGDLGHMKEEIKELNNFITGNVE